MKIKTISRISNKELEMLKVPNWLEKLFGMKPYCESYFLDLNYVYTIDEATHIIYNSDGEKLSILFDKEAIEIKKFLNKERLNICGK